jgi:hypothetical protein
VAENQRATRKGPWKNRMKNHRLELARLIDEVSGRIKCWAAAAASPGPDPDFDHLALRLFAFQYRHNPVLQRLCRARGITPEDLANWHDIPAIPASAFKEQDVTILDPAERTTIFHSSGTTSQTPSRHFHCPESLALYELSLSLWFSRCMPTERCNDHPGSEPTLLCLTPPPAQALHSSLVHMMATLDRALTWSETAFLCRTRGNGWELETEKTTRALQAAAASNRPCFILGTAFSFVHLLDHLETRRLRFSLPPGSRLMETGGYKGRSRNVPRDELHEALVCALGVSKDEIVCEYGMSELSSQAYGRPTRETRKGECASAASEFAASQSLLTSAATLFREPLILHFPPWARVMIIDPETGREAATGQTGLVRVVDLANVASVIALQTQDLGLRCMHGFRLLGRAAQAEPRGCSLMASGTL